MVRPLNILGMGLIILLLWFGFYQRGWTEERYTVKPGDTLYGISRSMGVSIEALKKANALEVESIKPRQVLTIPSRAGKKAAEVSGRSPSRASKKLSGGVVKRTTGEMDSYVVQKGDSLYNISKRVGFSTEEIIKRNGLPTSALKIGQILLLPRDGSRSDEEAEESGDEEEMAGTSQGEGEKGEPVASPLLENGVTWRKEVFW